MSDTDPDRDQMLDTLDTAIEEARRKAESGRVYDNPNERMRIKWIVPSPIRSISAGR